MNRTVNGLNLKYFKAAFIASILSILSFALPFASVGGKSYWSLGILPDLLGADEAGGMKVIFLLTFY